MSESSVPTNQEILDLLFLIAPQFYTTDGPTLVRYNTLIDSLRCMINVSVLGCCSALAYANLLAHYLTLSLNPSLGVANSISEGQLSISMATSIGQGFYQSSPYGQAYLQIIGRYRLGGYVTNSRYIGSWYGPPCGC